MTPKTPYPRTKPLDVLIVEDYPETIELLHEILSEYPLNIHSAQTRSEALAKAGQIPPALVLVDYKLPDGDGLTVLKEILEEVPQAQVILMSAYSTVTMAVEAVHCGALDVLDKPFKLPQLEMVIQRAIRVATLIAGSQATSLELRERFFSPELIGQSPPFMDALHLASQVAATDATVLITGESGTGKELFALAIHANSRRSRKPFFPVNCSAIPDTLLESELFGFRKGAFTGADEDRQGILERAGGGTVFLDEIAETSPAFQAKLLRFLQNREFLPLGSSSLQHCDVRVLVATNKPLLDWVHEGRFREDLYFRVNGFEIHLPPLRDRREDIPILAESFLKEIAKAQSISVTGFSRKAIQALTEYEWPGNIRELRNHVEMGCILCRSETIEPADLFPKWRGRQSPAKSGDLPFPFPPEGIDLDNLEKNLIEAALVRSGHNISLAARLLGMSRHTFRYRCKKHKIPFGKGHS